MVQSIYLDYNGTTPHDPEVIAVMRPFLETEFGNPSSSHWYGIRPKRAVDAARRQVAGLLGCQSEEVFFTSGGTESNNHAIKGLALALKEKGRYFITSTVEHPAVLDVCRFLEQEGFETTRVDVDDTGMVGVNDVAATIRRRMPLRYRYPVARPRGHAGAGGMGQGNRAFLHGTDDHRRPDRSSCRCRDQGGAAAQERPLTVHKACHAKKKNSYGSPGDGDAFSSMVSALISGTSVPLKLTTWTVPCASSVGQAVCHVGVVVNRRIYFMQFLQMPSTRTSTLSMRPGKVLHNSPLSTFRLSGVKQSIWPQRLQ